MGFFQAVEIVHILISVFTISLAFSLPGFLSFPIVLVTLGAGFILHEMAHKFVAIKFGCLAVYRAWMEGLILAVVFAFATGGKFVFAAPGAVYIFKTGLTRFEDGLISLAGPLTNMLFGFGLLFLLLGTPFAGVGLIGFKVNMFLGLFNMVPIGPLDGAKVMRWSGAVWALFFGCFIVFNFVWPMNFFL
ncbi:MAG: site-2 protease family protein [Candidatus Micrarchaeota archaeon]